MAGAARSDATEHEGSGRTGFEQLSADGAAVKKLHLLGSKWPEAVGSVDNHLHCRPNLIGLSLTTARIHLRPQISDPQTPNRSPTTVFRSFVAAPLCVSSSFKSMCMDPLHQGSVL
ncbi:sigma-54-dependent Fis family transcriptional regulator [Sesbania bispinosa]|nr:sigma-54-dependent Fis family transcriptional regulator [Sesbania bispinosa]